MCLFLYHRCQCVINSLGFLEVFEFPEPPCPKVLCYDHQWLAITKAVNQLMPLDRLPWQPPFQAGSDRFEQMCLGLIVSCSLSNAILLIRASFVPTEDDMKEIHEIFKGDFTVSCPMQNCMLIA